MNSIHKTIKKERKKRPGTREKNISVQMKKNIGAQKSKETRVGMKDGRMEMVCSVYPAYIYVQLPDGLAQQCMHWSSIQLLKMRQNHYNYYETCTIINLHFIKK